MAADPLLEVFVLLGFGLTAIFIRITARVGAVGARKLSWDDYLMILAAVIYCIETYLAFSVTAVWGGIANNGLTDAERHAIQVDSEEFRLRVGGSITQIVGQNSYTALLWTLKMAVCCFYCRLTESLKGYQMRVKIAFAFVGISWFYVHMTLLAGCVPFHKYWQINPDPGNFCQAAISHLFIISSLVFDVLTDAYLMSIPLPMLWSTELPNFKKYGLMVLFSGATFVMIAAFLRCIILMTDPVEGAAQSGAWACRETFVAVVTSNIPATWSSIAIMSRQFKAAKPARKETNRSSGDSGETGEEIAVSTELIDSPKQSDDVEHGHTETKISDVDEKTGCEAYTETKISAVMRTQDASVKRPRVRSL